MKFGERVKELRKKERITQRQLAEMLDVNFTYVSKIENDKLEAPPSEKLIRQLALELKTDPDELVALSGKIDHRKFQDIAMRKPEASSVLRRMQRRPPTTEQWRKIGKVLDDDNEGKTSDVPS